MQIPKPVRTNTEALEKKADILFSQHIRSIGKCQLQGLDGIKCGGRLDPMHLVTRGIKNLRWDIENAIAGCRNHHTYYTNHPKLWRELLQEHFTGMWNYIEENKNIKFHENMELVIKELESWT